MTSIARAVRRPFLRPLTIALALVFLASAAPFGPSRPATTAAAIPVTAGYSDYAYSPGAGADDVTAARVQSKLWTNDGRWFGVLFDPVSTPSAVFRIFRFDMATQNWTNTGVTVDPRNRSHMDVLSVDGTTVYVASSRAEGTATPTSLLDLRIYKYTYNAVSKTYALVPGFPKLIPSTTNGTSYSTIAQDETGRLWVAFTQAKLDPTASNRVLVSSSSDGGATWSVPIYVPGQGNSVTSDDIAAIATMNGGVGVLWSNQTPGDESFYFAAHKNIDPVGTWQARETAFGGFNGGTFNADGHISLKTDASGNLIAAIKTGLDEKPGPNGGDPLISVIKRTGSADAVGTWESHTVSTVTQDATRPVLVLDSAADQANVFMTYPTLASADPTKKQAIYRRTAPLSTLNFGAASVGTQFIASETDTAINDATSTKQITAAATGILVEATNIPNRRYLHGCAGDPCPAAPVADFTGTPTSGNAPLTVNFTDSSTNTPTSWSWNFGDGGTSTAQNPSHTYSDPNPYTVSLTATNLAGSDVETKSGYINVSAAPANRFFPITPKRILDTGHNIGLSGPFMSSVPRTFEVESVLPAGEVPAGATVVAVTGNLTVLNQSAAGYVSLGPDLTSTPGTSTINVPLGDVRANGVTVMLGASGRLTGVYKVGTLTGKRITVIFDVTGFFATTTTGGNTFKPIAPTRVFNTRKTTIMSSNVPRTFPVAGEMGIDPNAVAVTGNLTVDNQTAAGYVSLGPISTMTPQTSTLNFPLGDTRANGVTVKLDDNGDLTAIYKVGGGAGIFGKRANLFFDVTGYFVAGAAGYAFVPLPPARIVNTRKGIGLPGPLHNGAPGGTWSAAGHDGVASDAVAIVGNATIANQTKAGYLSLTTTPVWPPTSSTINFPLHDDRANGFTVALSGDNMSGAYYAGSAATTNLFIDVMGYYH